TVFANKDMLSLDTSWGIFALVEALIFFLVLSLGLVYMWKKGDLDWIKEEIPATKEEIGIAEELYEQVNRKYTKSIV
ncbi:MAG: NADH-quinone oxidoreductase subunit A, partial [Bacteroidota bacterium]